MNIANKISEVLVMKKFLKATAIVLVIAMIACFAACGGSGDDAFKIGVQTNTTGDLYSTWDFGEDKVVRYDNGAVAVQALKSGKVDCVIIDNEPAKAFVAERDNLVILDTAYAEEQYAIAVSKENTELLDSINKALKELTEDGTLQKIVDKYISAE